MNDIGAGAKSLALVIRINHTFTTLLISRLL